MGGVEHREIRTERGEAGRKYWSGRKKMTREITLHADMENYY